MTLPHQDDEIKAAIVASLDARHPSQRPDVAAMSTTALLELATELLDESMWTGPKPDDLDDDGHTLHVPVPPERWPYGPPGHHQDGCGLRSGGLFCDCGASASDDEEWGAAT